MAVIAADLALVVRIHPLVQPGVYFPYDLKRIGMFALAVLGYFVRMTAGAILGGDDGGDGHLVFLFTVGQVRAGVILFMCRGHVLITGLGQVAIQAGDVGTGMPALRPIVENARIDSLMALDAGHGFRGHTAFDAVLLRLGEVGLRQAGDRLPAMASSATTSPEQTNNFRRLMVVAPFIKKMLNGYSCDEVKDFSVPWPGRAAAGTVYT